MSRYPNHDYPAPRPMMSIEEFIDFLAENGKYSQPEYFNHFETRRAFAEYSLWIRQEPKRWLLDRLPLPKAIETLDAIPGPPPNADMPKEYWIDYTQTERIIFREVFELLLMAPPAEAPSNLQSICFMWWELCGYSDPDQAKIMRDLWQELLASPCIAIQESALHGLGHHIQFTNDKDSQKLIDDYLAQDIQRPRELVKYAKDARRGNVL